MTETQDLNDVIVDFQNITAEQALSKLVEIFGGDVIARAARKLAGEQLADPLDLRGVYVMHRRYAERDSGYELHVRDRLASEAGVKLIQALSGKGVTPVLAEWETRDGPDPYDETKELRLRVLVDRGGW